MAVENLADLITRQGESATLQTRSLGDRDSETGFPAVTYSDSTIKVFVKHLSSRVVETEAGPIVEVRKQMYTTSSFSHLDRVVYKGDTYEVETEPEEHYHGGSVAYRSAVLLKVS